ncbi:hypothetical protein ACRALDRAFT_1083447 [Sodiomyces alcalophilus JCM 7366]|uniref:uncharacterized protein n=1 Tax=Sodiomyces alcalophilus JCM 7366 TaxID=591952 RepID=UPI0039B37EA8
MDDVSKFLQDVKEMNARRTEEDDARQRELDEKIQQEKKERQARRAERARSISPQKSSPANTPPPSSQRHATQLSGSLRLSPAIDPSASARPLSAASNAVSISTEPISKQIRHSLTETAQQKPPVVMPKPSSPNNPSPGPRALSWQRRPPSQASDSSRSRPLSMVARPTPPVAASESSPAAETTFTRDQIAQALGSKDPTWFRQTADRGLGSAAYRKTQVEDPDTLDMSSMRAQLPGMSRVVSTETPERPFNGRRLASPLSLTSGHRLDPPSEKTPPPTDVPTAPNRDRALSIASPVSGRSSPTKPPSPTKGMGGFVQSAMMKRSDSVKRWSVASPPGIARGDSIASGRGGDRSSMIRSKSRPTSMFRERTDISVEPSRPGSRQGEQAEKTEQTDTHAADTTPKAGTVSSDATSHNTTVGDNDEPTIPISPSKTMDPRRWSPTKASWLETALNKPDSPKPKPTPPPTNQPAWMVELNKAKAQKANNPNNSDPNPGKPAPPAPSKHSVNIGGLMRSTPMGAAAKVSPAGLGGIYSPPSGAGHRRGTGSISIGSGNLRDALSTRSGTPSPTKTEPDTRPTATTTTAVDPEEKENKPAAPQPRPLPPPAAGKPKPQTPPKKDFRANLKPRQASVDSSPSVPRQEQQMEFKSVFGTLRRAETKNYVAPDELKHNIMRGKAALNATGGPRPSERKDEFKEAILKKKASFRKTHPDGRPAVTVPPPSAAVASENPLPEGLAKRAELHKSVPGRKDAAADYGIETSLKNSREAAEVAVAVPIGQNTEKSAPVRLQGRPGGGGLADRFNPALAGLLARGPPSMTTNGGGSRDGSDTNASSDAAITESSVPRPQLTHMTKNRARGPRRKAPSSAQPAAVSATTPKPSTVTTPAKPVQTTRSTPVRSPFARPSASTEEEDKGYFNREAVSRSTPPPPISPSSSLPKSIQARVAVKAAAMRHSSSPQSSVETSVHIDDPQTPSKLRLRQSSTTPLGSDMVGRLRDGHVTPPTPGRKLPSPPATKQKPAGIIAPFGPLGTLNRTPSPTKPSEPNPPEESEPPSAMKFDTKGVSRFMATEPVASSPKPEVAEPETATRESVVPSPPLRSSNNQPTEVSAFLDGFFGTPRPKREYSVDTAEILTNRPKVPKTQPASSATQLFQLFGDGKKRPVPAHNERVLFEQDMYICAHHHHDETGRKVSEVYFWAGDQVAASTVEDAQLFAGREARALAGGSRLVRLRQGKETPAFLHALGGIVITRRGSSDKHDSLAPAMLCGRRHLGHVVLDEVDLSPSSLCSGFPFLVARDGKCHLWKGRGSDVDELSCARLVGMDLSMTGELVEVDEGREPDSFWRLFDDGLAAVSRPPSSADHWRLKPDYGKYCGRLFLSDAASPQQIIEISPFSQADLHTTNVYILDAFFEMYILVGRHAQSQYPAFRNALDFAQEYAILASSMEDRPFVPVSTVVLEGIPRDLKRVFRKWRDDASPTVLLPQHGQGRQQGLGSDGVSAGGLKRGRSLRVVTLTQALRAISE